jgi:biotin operon repressor
VKKCDYAIIYVPPNGSHIGLYAELDENEVNEIVQHLQDNGLEIVTVRNNSLHKTYASLLTESYMSSTHSY